MEQDYRTKPVRGRTQVSSIVDFTRAFIILVIGIIMFVGDKIGVKALTELLQSRDELIRYFFGGLCLFYGGFRLYRAIKKDY